MRGNSFCSALVLAAAVWAGGAGAAPAAEISITATQAAFPGGLKNSAEIATVITTATPVEWPAGAMTLAQMIEKFSVNGNRIDVESGIDLTAIATVAAFSGSWWDAVDAACAAFDLALLPAPMAQGESSSSNNLRGTAVGLAFTGPVLGKRLASRATLTSGRGSLRAELGGAELTSDGRLSGRLSLRLEPRLDSLGIRAIGISDSRGGNALTLQGTDYSDADTRVRLTSVIKKPATQTAAMQAQIIMALPWSAAGDLPEGDTLVISLGSDTFNVKRDGGKGLIITGRSGGNRGVDYARMPTLRVSRDGNQLNQRGSSFNSNNNEFTMTLRFADMAGGPVRVEISGSLPTGDIKSDIPGFSLKAFPASPQPLGDAAALVATAVRWPAQPAVTLGDAMMLLQNSGNQVSLGVGVDERAVVALSDFNGTFWEAAVHLAKAYKLGVAPSAQADGAVVFTPGNANTKLPTPAGPFLIRISEITREAVNTLSGVDQRAALRLAITPEPRMGARFGRPQLSLVNQGETGGVPCIVTNGAAAPDDSGDEEQALRMHMRMRMGGGGEEEPPRSTGTMLALSRLPIGAVNVRLRGTISGVMHEPVEASVTIRPNVRAAVTVSDQPMGFCLLNRNELIREFPEQMNNMGNRGGPQAALLVLGMPQNGNGPRIRIKDANDQEVQSNNSSGFGRGVQLMYLNKLVDADYTITVSTRRTIGMIAAPLDLIVAIP